MRTILPFALMFLVTGCGDAITIAPEIPADAACSAPGLTEAEDQDCMTSDAVLDEAEAQSPPTADLPASMAGRFRADDNVSWNGLADADGSDAPPELHRYLPSGE